ncbi:MAG: squalene synthase HpnC [Pirellulales bacterium]
MGRREWNFSDELSEWGPGGSRTAPLPTLREACEYTQYVALTHYENFHVAGLLLPRELRQDFYNVYAYCRWSDDLGDEIGDSSQSLRLLSWWEEELDRCFAGSASHPVMIALHSTVNKIGCSPQPFHDLLSAFRQDQSVTRYDTRDSLVDYCRRSADPVGRLVLCLAGVTVDTEMLRLSDSICTGLQLANFCQDMQRDAAGGRIYAPRDLQACHGVTESMILAQQVTEPLRAMLREWTMQTREYFEIGKPLERMVDAAWLRSDLRLFRTGGLAILDAIERFKFDVWTRRPVVSKWKKASLLFSALIAGRLRR